jgi:riboflavin kinase / FMN adenylyltransferase
MRRFHGKDEVPHDFGPTVVTLGCFDGVHKGHQLILAHLRSAGEMHDAKPVVVTFDRLPAQSLRPDSAPQTIMGLDARLDALEAQGVVGALVLSYTPELAAQSPEDFVQNIFVNALKASAVVVGRDCRFGHKRSGDVETLNALGSVLNFEVKVIDDLVQDHVRRGNGVRFSSTAIRTALRDGDVEAARELLGRPHEIRMKVLVPSQNSATTPAVCHGNSTSISGLLPSDGEYAGWIRSQSRNARQPVIARIVRAKTPSRSGAASAAVALRRPDADVTEPIALYESDAEVIVEFAERLSDQ